MAADAQGLAQYKLFDAKNGLLSPNFILVPNRILMLDAAQQFGDSNSAVNISSIPFGVVYVLAEISAECVFWS